MRHTLYIIIAAALLSACSQIEPEDRLTAVPFLPEDLIQRNVLIEDFTGQNCPNCPTATDVIEGLEEGYEGHVVGVSIHSGNLGRGMALWTPYGDTRFDKLGKDLPQPTVRVDRTNAIYTGGNEVQNGLHSGVKTQLQKSSPITIGSYSCTQTGEEGKSLTYSVRVASTKDINAMVQVWIIEDGIVSRQKMPDGSSNKEYVHKSAFRATMTADEGEPMQIGAGMSQEFGLTYDAYKFKGNMDNCHAVVIVSLPNDGEVLQVAKFPLVSK